MKPERAQAGLGVVPAGREAKAAAFGDHWTDSDPWLLNV